MSKLSSILGWVGAGILGAAVVGVASGAANSSLPIKLATQGTAELKEAVRKPEVVVQTETKEVEIPYESQTVDDVTLAKDTYVTRVAGVNGKRLDTYSVTYTDGAETARTLISSEVISEPVTEVIAHGIYVYVAPPATTQNNCPNGTYTNAYGNQVCRPSSQANGATAVCHDGTYSYSQSRSGTCSHHGGVAQWL